MINCANLSLVEPLTREDTDGFSHVNLQGSVFNATCDSFAPSLTVLDLRKSALPHDELCEIANCPGLREKVRRLRS